MEKCPRCHLQVTELHAMGPEFEAQVQVIGESVTGAICLSCLSDLRKVLSQSRGGTLLAQERAKEAYRLDLWKNRVALIKKARDFMSGKNYTAAAVTYEKYLKVLEIVFALKKGQPLTPKVFKDSARTSEITVVASVYWDLLRIYDTNDKYNERQHNAGKQLASFIQYSPIYPDIIKRAEAFVKSAKNPGIIKTFIKDATQQRPKCFIATSTYGDPFAPEVIYLRLFRDYFLCKYALGRFFTRIYYVISPPIADAIERRPILKKCSSSVLNHVIKCIRHIY
ncbi:MAG: hypothetical protein JNL11_12960 [Bdellovibrionaceae bacterium]|nr:hypothetical protein [Pseudobdellovibrionaceae bacterium]